MSHVEERMKTYQTLLISQKRCSQLQCPSQRRCSTLPVNQYSLRLFWKHKYMVDLNLSKWGYELPLSHPIRVDQPHRSRQSFDEVRQLRSVPICRLDCWLPLCHGGVVRQVAEGVQVQVARGAGTGETYKRKYLMDSGWQKLAAFRRGQKWPQNFSSGAYLLFLQKMRCFCA